MAGPVLRSWIGTILLYGAALVHVALALKRVVRRRTLRMPVPDAIQMTLGLLIPFLIVGHIIGTRLLHSYGGLDTTYVHVLRCSGPITPSASRCCCSSSGVMA